MPVNNSPSEVSADYELLSTSQQPHRAKPTTMGGDEQLLKPEGRKGDTLALYTALGAVAVMTATTWATVLNNDPTANGWFSLHPLMQTLSIAVITYGILTLQPTSQPKTKAAGLARHQLAIILIGLPCILLGSVAIMYHKELKGSEHGTTWHSTFGLLSLTWLLFQIGLGGASVWFGGAVFGGGAKAKAVWKYHRASGYVLFPMLLLTAHLGGGRSNWSERYIESGLRSVAFTAAPVLIVISIYARSRSSKMQF